MDGLTISKAKDLLNTGKTTSELNNKRVLPDAGSDQVSFSDTFNKAVNHVNDLQKDADVKMQQLATGETSDIAGVKIAAEKADIALRLMTSVRNKMIDAYHEIMKMQV